MSDRVVDIRGEPCGMPVLRVERFLLDEAAGGAFTVRGDYEQTLDQLFLLATRHGWTCEVTREKGPDWRAEFRPPGKP
jgi:TusA-related sulfurtransferase